MAGILQLATNEATLGPCRVETLKEEVEVSRHSNIKVDSSADQGSILRLAMNEAVLGPHRVETLKEEVKVSRCSNIRQLIC